jgi:acetyl-CoA acetyltransferase family protein
MKECVLVDGVRTPTGRAHNEKGDLRTLRPEELLGAVYKAIFDRNAPLKPEEVDLVTIGCANQSGAQNVIGRLSWLCNGYPESVAVNGIEMQCASAMAGMEHCARGIMTGELDITIAGGVEMMARIAMGANMEPPPSLTNRYPNFMDLTMGMTAEKVAAQWKIERKEMEEFALASHQKAAKAHADGCFKDEIVPIEVTYEDGSKKVVERDQCVRGDTTLEKMAGMQPAFKPDGVVTAAVSSPLNDGASAVLLMSREKADQLGLSYTLKYRGGAMAGVDPTIMGIGPIPAVQKLLKLTGVSIDQIDVVEINEAFASQSIACLRDLGIPYEKANQWGGALAIGHPLGQSGTRITVTLNSIMKANPSYKLGMSTLCVGFGQGNATLWERVS